MDTKQKATNAVIIFYPDGTHYTPAWSRAHRATNSSNNTTQITNKQAVRVKPSAIICYPDGTTQPLQDSHSSDTQILSPDINKRFNQIIDSSLPNSNLNQYFRDHYNSHYNFIFKGERGGIYRKVPLIAYIRSLLQKQQEKVHNDTSHFWDHMLANRIKHEQKLIQKLVPCNGDTVFILTQNLFGEITDCHAVTNKDIPPLQATLRDYIKIMTPVSKWKDLMPRA